MSFDAMKVAELKEIAESFAVDLEDAKNKSEILAVLAEEGITYDMYKQFADSEKEELEPEEEEVKPVVKEKPKKAGDTVLVKMDRHNFTYQTFGYTFTAEHPYVAIPEKDAQLIFDNEEGFRMATPREVQEFYS
jgi:parvulin-like peptidyl-prolyl isomerase